MTPQRVTLRGFLSYRHEQVLDFSGAPVWMLAGPNGSGKSAVFDAVTYALFGRHRSGATDAIELINKNCEGLAVEFEFDLSGERFLAHRTLKRSARARGTSTQQILRADNSGGPWTPVPDTNKKQGFDEWVERNIGLRYETFTASVLLLQGQAERLLSQTPADRFKVLADVVDLQRYMRLHERVDERRKELKAEFDVLEGQWAGLAVVTPAELAQARDRCEISERERARLAQALEECRTAETAAHRWADLQKRSAALAQRRAQSERLVAGAADAERDVRRLRELDAAIPIAERALAARAGIDEATRAIAGFESESGAAEAALATLLADAGLAAGQRDILVREGEADDAASNQRAQELQTIAAALARAELIDQQQQQLEQEQIQLAALPADLEQRRASSQQCVDELLVLERGLPALTRLHRERNELGRRREQAAADAMQLAAITEHGKELAVRLAKIEERRSTSITTLRDAATALTTARTLESQAEAALRSLQTLGDMPNCSWCGQKLTEAHRQQEGAKRTAEAQAARRASQEAAAAHHTALTTDEQIAQEFAAITKERDAARDQYRGTQSGHDHAVAEIARLEAALTATFDELLPTIRTQVAPTCPRDWPTTGFPTEHDIESIAQRVTALTDAKRELQGSQTAQATSDKLRAKIESLRQAIAKVGDESPAPLADVRQQHARIDSEAKALTNRIAARRTELRRLEGKIESGARNVIAARAKSAQFASQVSAERARLDLRQSAWTHALAELPVDWKPLVETSGLTELLVWKGEREKLADDGVEQKLAAAAAARADLDAIATESVNLDAEVAGIAEADRRDVAGIVAQIALSRQHLATAENAARTERDNEVRLESLARQREVLKKSLDETRIGHERHKALAELLGRDRLQMHLVRTAERQIVEHANAVLDRISGGELHLRQRNVDEPDAALDLEVINLATSVAPIPVAFLSGSQRFRVAVSLALGIGRFASGRHRPVEAVIIDEGFGCLDRNGRQVMIQELQNLRDFMKRIILVSHQEEFSDAFSDGYQIELVDGATRATRFQR